MAKKKLTCIDIIAGASFIKSFIVNSYYLLKFYV